MVIMGRLVQSNKQKGNKVMEMGLTLLMVFIVWQGLRVRYQRTHIALLSQYLSQLQLERHMETLTTTYTRAINEQTETRQLQVLATVNQTEEAVAAQVQRLADSLKKDDLTATTMNVLAFNFPFLVSLLPNSKRDFRELVQIHANGLRHVVDNTEALNAKDRAYHLSAELYLFQHSCHWFCKSRTVADARLMVRHKVDHKKVLASVSQTTRSAYEKWLHNS